MGRKLFEAIVVLASFLAFGLIFVASNAAAASSDLRVYVKMQPENPNAIDGIFWEGNDVRVKLELQWGDLGNQKDWKIYYTWDVLETGVREEYREPFMPITGEHWLFAYAVNEQEKVVTIVTKFFVQFRRAPKVLPAEQIFVSGETVKWGLAGIPPSKAKQGQITAEATSTARTVAASNAVAAPSSLQNLQNFVMKLVSGRTNLWIMLLMIGLFLLVAVKIIFKEKE